MLSTGNLNLSRHSRIRKYLGQAIEAWIWGSEITRNLSVVTREKGLYILKPTAASGVGLRLECGKAAGSSYWPNAKTVLQFERCRWVHLNIPGPCVK